MTATLNGEPQALRAKRASLAERLAAVQEELSQLSKELEQAHGEWNIRTLSFWRSKEHVDSAWRAVSYAAEYAAGMYTDK